MDLPSDQPVHARDCHGQDRRHDPRKAQAGADHRKLGLYRRLILPLCLWLAIAAPALAEPTRIAFFNAALSRPGPGLLLRDLQRGEAQATAAIAVMAAVDADILVLADVDYDHDLLALRLLAERLGTVTGRPYPHLFARMPNRGLSTGLDLDGDGRLGEPEDAQSFADFPGQGGLAILSRLPVAPAEARDFTSLLWADQPGALWPDGLGPDARATLRLSSAAHWAVPVEMVPGRRLWLMAWHGSTPAFDGPEDRNGRRNHDETAFWQRLIARPDAPPAPFVILGQANADPEKGDGRPEAIRALLADPRLTDPLTGDTVDYGGAIGRLRVAYILPSRDLAIIAAGHGPADPAASRHWPIWVDLAP